MSALYENIAVGSSLINSITADWNTKNFWSFYEERYNLGSGMRFSFPTIEVVKNASDNTYYKYLHSDSGAVYRLVSPTVVNGVTEYKFEGYQLDDIRLIEDNASSPVYNYTTNGVANKSKYILIDKNGTKTYFSDKDSSGADPEKYEGRILAIVDRYGNEIKFEYSSLSYTVGTGTYATKTRKLITKIIDTVGRQANIEYLQDQTFNVNLIGNNMSDGALNSKFNIKITTPDNQMIVYEKSNLLYYSNANPKSVRERIQYVYKLEDATTYSTTNLGNLVYWYWYEKKDYKFNYTGSTFSPIYVSWLGGNVYNKWENIVFIKYPGYKAKYIEYTDGTKKLGSKGAQTYRKVSIDADVLYDNWNIDSNYVLTYTGTDVRKLTYTYEGEPDGYASGNKVYPLIDFEDADSMNYFTYNSYWTRSTSAASDGGNGLISRSGSNASTSTIRLSVNLDEPGLLSFDCKKTGTGDITLYVYIDGTSFILASNEDINSGWRRYEAPLSKGSYYLEFRAEKNGTNDAQICVDNISVGKYYYTTVADALSVTNINTTYVYNPKHIMQKIYQDGSDHASVEFREYDFRNMLKRKQTVHYDKSNGISVDAPIYNVEKYTYDNYGNLTEYIDSVDPNIKYIYTYYGADKYRKLQSKTVQQGVSTILSQTLYDLSNAGNTIKETRKHKENSVVKDAITDYSFDAKGNMTSKTTYTAGDQSNAFTINYVYGAVGSYSAGMLYLTRVYTGGPSSPIADKAYQYNFNRGLMTAETDYINTTNTSLTTSYQYDYKSRLQQITYPNNTNLYYYYSDYGFYTSYDFAINIYGQGTDIIYTYDVLGNLLSTHKYYGYVPLSSYKYDSRGNIVRETDGKGNYTAYQFDSASRLISKKQYSSSGVLQSGSALSFIDIQNGKLGYDIIDSVLKAESGYDDTYILKTDGTVWKVNGITNNAMGDVTLAQVPGLSGITDISAGSWHVLALKSDGTVYAWGNNSYGQLGNNTYLDSSTPVQVKNSSGAAVTGITKISAGSIHNLALKSDKTVLAWGMNYYGQLGNNSTSNSPVPVPVSSLSNVREISANESSSSYAIKEDNTAWSWGNNYYRQLGAGLTVAYRATPVQMTGMTSASKIYASLSNVAILTNNKTVYTCGWNAYGQLGTGSTAEYVGTLTQVPNLTNVSTMGSSSYAYYAIHSDGSVSTWGGYRGVALGAASLECVNIPIKIPELNGIQAASGGHSSVVFKNSSGRVIYMDLLIYFPNGDKLLGVARFLTLGNANPSNFRHSMTLTDEDGYKRIYYYDKNNRLVGMEETPDNNTFYLTKYTYDHIGNKTSVTNPRGLYTTYEYDDLDRLITKAERAAPNPQLAPLTQTTYEYNAIDMLTKKTEPDNKITQYSYDAAGRLTWEKVGGNDIASKYFYKNYETYDRSGNVLSLKQGYTTSGDPGRVVDAHTKYEYNNRNRASGQYDLVEGTTYRYSYYEYNNTGDITLEKVYSAGTTDAGGYMQTIYAYDDLRRITLTTTTAYYQYQYVGTIKTGYDYDASNNVTYKKDYMDATTYLTTEYDYDSINRVTEIREPVGEVNATRKTKFVYDNRGNLTGKTLVLNGQDLTTSYVYDGMGCLTSETNALNKTTRYGYDSAGNRTIAADARYANQALTTANGYRYTYDQLDRPIKTEAYSNGSLETLEQRSYDGRGNVTGVKLGNKTVASKMAYDAADNLIAYTPADVAAKGSTNIGKEMTYNGLGAIISAKQYYSSSENYTTTYQYYGTGLIKSVTYPDSATPVTYTYDNTGRLFEQVTERNAGVTKIWKSLFGAPYKTEFPDGTTQTTVFDWYLGLAIAFVDQKGRRRERKYNKNNKLVQERFSCGGTSAQKYWLTTKYTYDEWDNLKTVENFDTVTNTAGTTIVSETSLNNKVTHDYDNVFRDTSVYDVTGREQLFGYDDAGNLITHKIKTAGNEYDVKRYEYDAIGRLSADIALIPAAQLYDATNYPADAEYANMKKAATTYTYTADKVAASMSPRGYQTVYGYDDSLNVITVTRPHGNVITYAYNFAGQVKAETISDGPATTFYFDQAGRATKKTALAPNGQTMAWEKKYDVMGNVISEATPSLYKLDQSYSYKYNIMDRRTAAADADGNVLEVYAYDAAGNLVKKVNAKNGSGTVNVNTFDGSLAALTNLSGDVLGYDDFDRATSKTDALGNTVSYEYDLMGNLTKSIDARGYATQYFYSADSTLQYVLYPDGGRADYAYDKKGRKTSESVKQSSSVTITQSYTYTPFGTVFTVNDPYSKTIQNCYDGEGNLTKVTDKRLNTMTIAYDGNNRVTDRATPITAAVSQLAHYTYNAAGQVTTESVSGAGAQARTKTYTYAHGFLVSSSNSAGQEAIFGYDDCGNQNKVKVLREAGVYDETCFEFDKYGRNTAIYKNIPVGAVELFGVTQVGGMVISRTEYGYDTLGNKTWEKAPMAFVVGEDAAEYTTSYGYDALLRLESVGAVYKGSVANTVYTYDENGNIKAVKDALNNVTEYDYDQMDRLKKVTYAKGTGVSYQVSYQYDLAGNKTAETLPSGTWLYEYDLLNRLSTTKDPYNTVTGKNIYDDNGNISKKIDGRGYLSANNDNARYGTVYTYNKANLIEAVTDAEGVTIEYKYNAFGEMAEMKDGLANTTVYDYDGAGALASVTDPLGKVTLYGYDKAGNRTSVTDAKAHVTGYAYSAFGLLLSITDPAGRAQTYKYNLTGQQTKMVDKLGNTTCYVYNSLGLLTNMSVVEAGGSAAADSIGYDYDCLGNRTDMTDSTGAYVYAYDALLRLTSISKNNAVQISYTYTEEGSIKTASYGGTTTAYAYFSDGRLNTVRNSGEGADYSYDASGNIVQIAYIGGAKEQIIYYKNNTVQSVINRYSNNGLLSIHYNTYDGAGRQDSKVYTYGTATYTYDACGRLENVAMPGKTTAYTYDDAGNRETMTETYSDPKTFNGDSNMQYVKKESAYEYSSCDELIRLTEKMYDASNAFIVGKESSYLYDANGNQFSIMTGFLTPAAGNGQSGVSPSGFTEGTQDFEWYTDFTTNSFDVWNRLIKRTAVKDSMQTISEFTYNGDGLRTSKTVKASTNGYAAHTTNYLYDGQYVVQESGGATATYIRGYNYIANIGVSNVTDYYMYNAHGDVVEVVSGNGTIKNRYEYDPFGETILEIEETDNSIKYAGEFYDLSTDLYYLRSRYMDPAIGRFISPDAFFSTFNKPTTNINDIKQMTNLYSYCMGDPINYKDPTGLAVAGQNGVPSAPNTGADWLRTGSGKSFEEFWGISTGSSSSGSSSSGSSSSSSSSSGSSSRPTAPNATNLGSLSSQSQSNINSAYNAWQGGYISQQQYVDNVTLNGGTLANFSPANMGKPITTGIGNDANVGMAGGGIIAPNGVSDVVRNRVIGQIATSRGISVADATIIYDNEMQSGSLSADANGVFSALTAEGVILREVNIFVGSAEIQTVFYLDDRNYGGLREMVDTLQGVGSVSFDPVTGIATFDITNQQTGVTTAYTVDVSTLNNTTPNNGMLLVNDRVMVGLRWLAERAGLDDTLTWWNEGNASYAVMYTSRIKQNGDTSITQGAQTYVTHYTQGYNNADGIVRDSSRTSAERVAAITQVEWTLERANDIRNLDGLGLVQGRTLNVPVYNQLAVPDGNGTQLCWSASVAIWLSLLLGDNVDRTEAIARAVANDMVASGVEFLNPDGTLNFNVSRPWMTTDYVAGLLGLTGITATQTQTLGNLSMADLQTTVDGGSPFGVLYRDATSGHWILGTGYATETGHDPLVVSIDPWGGVQSIQTYNVFQTLPDGRVWTWTAR